MIVYDARIIVEQDKQPAFEAMMKELRTAVLANEPGVRVYELCHSSSDQRAYRMIEIYEDQATIDAHMKTEWFGKAVARFGEFFAEPPVLDQLVTVD